MKVGSSQKAVRRHPYGVVLFDEIEKAHADVFNVLLQLLDDGRLTDGHGRTVDFKNAVVIMTSNIGSQWISAGDLDVDEIRNRVTEAMQQHFRPEFLNRIDDLIIFQSTWYQGDKKDCYTRVGSTQRPPRGEKYHAESHGDRKGRDRQSRL